MRRGALSGGQGVSQVRPKQAVQSARRIDAGPIDSRANPPAAALQAIARHAEARIEVMRLLRGIRVAQGLAETAMAARLETAPRIVMALEKGDLAALPEWSETRRIVDRWVTGAGLDPRPALGGLALALDGYGFTRTPRSRGNREPGAEVEGRTTRVPWLRFAVGLPPARVTRWAAIVLIAAALATTATRTTVVAGAISKLPAPAERAMRSISDYFAVRFAPVYEGHRWIDVENPQSRRGDKLRIGRHSD